MTSKQVKVFIKENKHRDFKSAKIILEERYNVNNQLVSNIIVYFFDKYGIGDYQILSSKKLPLNHEINKTLLKHFKLIFEKEC